MAIFFVLDLFFCVAYFIWHCCFGLSGVVYFFVAILMCFQAVSKCTFCLFVSYFVLSLCFNFAAIFAGKRMICFCLWMSDSTLRFIALLCYFFLLEMLCGEIK